MLGDSCEVCAQESAESSGRYKEWEDDEHSYAGSDISRKSGAVPYVDLETRGSYRGVVCAYSDNQSCVGIHKFLSG